jgi:hypothetical protein
MRNPRAAGASDSFCSADHDDPNYMVLNQFPFPVKLSKLNLNSIVLESLTTAYHKEYVTAE